VEAAAKVFTENTLTKGSVMDIQTDLVFFSKVNVATRLTTKIQPFKKEATFNIIFNATAKDNGDLATTIVSGVIEKIVGTIADVFENVGRAAEQLVQKINDWAESKNSEVGKIINDNRKAALAYEKANNITKGAGYDAMMRVLQDKMESIDNIVARELFEGAVVNFQLTAKYINGRLQFSTDGALSQTAVNLAGEAKTFFGQVAAAVVDVVADISTSISEELKAFLTNYVKGWNRNGIMDINSIYVNMILGTTNDLDAQVRMALFGGEFETYGVGLSTSLLRTLDLWWDALLAKLALWLADAAYELSGSRNAYKIIQFCTKDPGDCFSYISWLYNGKTSVCSFRNELTQTESGRFQS
jgi:hypothetical protein